MKLQSNKAGSARYRTEMPEMPVRFGIGQRGNDPRHVSFSSHVQNAPRKFHGEISGEETVELLRQIICAQPGWIKEAADSVADHNKRAFTELFCDRTAQAKGPTQPFPSGGEIMTSTPEGTGWELASNE